MNISIKNWYSKSNIDIKYKILLVLSVLHYEKKISDEKLKGQFSSLRKGDLQKRKNTYHCTINDKWYNYDSVEEIFEDLLTMTAKTIPFDVFLSYIQKFHNCNKNYALNVFGSEYIYEMFKEWNPEYHSSRFNEYIDFYIPNIIAVYNDSNCSCCGSYSRYVDKFSEVNIGRVNDWLHNQKKGIIDKITKFDISSRQKNWFDR